MVKCCQPIYYHFPSNVSTHPVAGLLPTRLPDTRATPTPQPEGNEHLKVNNYLPKLQSLPQKNHRIHPTPLSHPLRTAPKPRFHHRCSHPGPTHPAPPSPPVNNTSILPPLFTTTPPGEPWKASPREQRTHFAPSVHHNTSWRTLEGVPS